MKEYHQKMIEFSFLKHKNISFGKVFDPCVSVGLLFSLHFPIAINIIILDRIHTINNNAVIGYSKQDPSMVFKNIKDNKRFTKWSFN